MSQVDKVYYLKDMELALFLSIKGMRELYGLKMRHIQNPDTEQVYRTFFELEKKKLISFSDKENITIYPELDHILEIIKNADKLLLYMNREAAHPDQCIYLGDGAVFVSVYGTAGDIKQIENVPIKYLPEAIYERGFQIEDLLSNESLLEEAEFEHSELEKSVNCLLDKELETLDQKEWGNVTDCLKLYSLKSQKYVKQYMLIKDKLSNYFAVTEEAGSHIFVYSKQMVIDTLRNDI